MTKAKKKLSTFQIIDDGVVFTFTSEPEGGYTVTIPSLPGCVSYGKTFEEAMVIIQDAIEGCLAVSKEEGLFVPEDVERYLAKKHNDFYHSVN